MIPGDTKLSIPLPLRDFAFRASRMERWEELHAKMPLHFDTTFTSRSWNLYLYYIIIMKPAVLLTTRTN